MLRAHIKRVEVRFCLPHDNKDGTLGPRIAIPRDAKGDNTWAAATECARRLRREYDAHVSIVEVPK